MRNLTEKKQLDSAKEKSQQSGKETIIFNNKMKREFFKFEDGSLVEFDLTKYKGKQIKLTEEESNEIKLSDI